MEQFSYILITLLGLVIGSFMNVVAVRLPKGESIVGPRSHCLSCSTPLKPHELIPVVSYIVKGGRCSHCGSTIPPFYLVVEIVTACLFVLAFWRFGWSFELFAALPLLSILVVTAHIDLRHKLIPNKMTYPGMIYFALLRLLYHPDPWWHYVLGFFVAGGLLLFIAIISRGGMGGGDIKLMAMAGLAIGWRWALLAFVVATLIGGLCGLLLLLLRRAGRKDAIAFGPFLAIGIVVAYVWGESIWHWYWTL